MSSLGILPPVCVHQGFFLCAFTCHSPLAAFSPLCLHQAFSPVCSHGVLSPVRSHRILFTVCVLPASPAPPPCAFTWRSPFFLHWRGILPTVRSCSVRPSGAHLAFSPLCVHPAFSLLCVCAALFPVCVRAAFSLWCVHQAFSSLRVAQRSPSCVFTRRSPPCAFARPSPPCVHRPFYFVRSPGVLPTCVRSQQCAGFPGIHPAFSPLCVRDRKSVV